MEQRPWRKNFPPLPEKTDEEKKAEQKLKRRAGDFSYLIELAIDAGWMKGKLRLNPKNTQEGYQLLTYDIEPAELKFTAEHLVATGQTRAIIAAPRFLEALLGTEIAAKYKTRIIEIPSAQEQLTFIYKLIDHITPPGD